MCITVEPNYIILDNQFRDIVNYAYCKPHPELPDNPKEAFERYNKLLERRLH